MAELKLYCTYSFNEDLQLELHFKLFTTYCQHYYTDIFRRLTYGCLSINSVSSLDVKKNSTSFALHIAGYIELFQCALSVNNCQYSVIGHSRNNSNKSLYGLQPYRRLIL